MLVSYVPVNGQRSTFPFPYVHHQPDNRKVGQLLTVENSLENTKEMCLSLYNIRDKENDFKNWKAETRNLFSNIIIHNKYAIIILINKTK